MLNKWNIFINEAKDVENLAARVVCVNKNNQILIMMRSEGTIINGNKWDIPGGHVDNSDKSFEFAALRELEEETCLKGNEENLIYLGRHDWCNDIVYYYGILAPKGDISLLPNPESGFLEHSEYEWATIDEIIQYEKQDLITFPIYLLRMALEKVQK